MSAQWIQKELWIKGMMLDSSEIKVENALRSIAGIKDVKASFTDSNVVFSYDPEKLRLKTVIKAIENIGYIASEKPPEPPKVSMPANRPNPSRIEDNKPGTVIRKELRIDGMTCTSCEMRIENRLKKTEGIQQVKVSFSNGTAKVSFDPQVISLNKIIEIIEKLDYKVVNNPGVKGTAAPKNAKKTSINQLVGIGIILLAAYMITRNSGFNFIPNISQNMGYGILFVVGLITSLHCVAMCGGISLSQTVSDKRPESDKSKLSKLKPSILYNAGRVISYTILGGIVGALGSVVSFSAAAKGFITIIAGIFMVMMGLNMLNVFPWLRKITPHMPKIFGKKLYAGSLKHGPFYIGLLNWLMPCGPLQAMQIYALGTGSPLKGALSMLVFSLGTVPLMFGFGAISSFLSGKFTHKMMKASAALVMFLGIVMLGRGFTLSGLDFVSALSPKSAASGNVAAVQGNEQTITTQLRSGSYTPITVQKGVPVKWIIKADASSINGCNGTIIIPQFNITKTLEPGDNEIDFTADRTGNITYTCSMGMITSTISVVDDVSKAIPSVSGESSSGSAASPVGVAKISGNKQDVTVTVDGNGFTPSILVLQKGIPAKIKFNPTQLSSCNSYIVFPELNSQLDLTSQTETPYFTPQNDFSFQCGMGMLRGYVKVVDDIHKIDLNAIQKEAENYVSSGGGMACCQ